MMKSIHTLLFLATMIPLSGQNGSNRIAVPTQNAIKNFELKKGVFETSVKMNDFSKWKMMFSIPEIGEGEKVNVVLALHWGVNSSGYERFMECLILPAFDQEKYLIIAPYAERQTWWSSPKNEQLISLIQSIKKHWPVDKIIVTGYSDGATGSIHLAHTTDEFDAAIGMAGSYRSIKQVNIPTYIVHGVGDQLFNYQQTKKVMDEAKKTSPDLAFITTKELTHFEACEYLEHLKDGIEWVEGRLKI